MTIGMILLTIVAVLVFFGVTQRVLDKMRLTDKAALILIAAMFFGTLIPNITLGAVSFSIGGALIPFCVCVYLFIKTDGKERLRSLIGAIIAGGIVFGLGRLLPSEPEQLPFDPLYLYGVAGGLVAYLLGRSRRGAFICGVVGVLLSDLANAVMVWSQGVNQPLVLGGAGVFDAVIIAGVIGVVLCELIGEVLERISRGKNPPEHERVVNPVKSKEGNAK